MANKKANDDDIKNLVAETETHKKELDRLSAVIDQPLKFAEIFCIALQHQNTMSEALKNKFRELIKTDNETIEVIKESQRKVNDDDWRTWVKSVNSKIKAVIIFVAGSAFTVILQIIIKRFTTT